jgi:hypothetical protein
MKVPIKSVVPNPKNPRVIKDEKYKKLLQSIKSFPQMLDIRTIVVNDDMIVIGGNMRLRACQELGFKEIEVVKASDLTPEQRKEFIIKDNLGYGEWDWAMLEDDFEIAELEEWGLDILFKEDYSNKNEEIDIDDLDKEMILKFKFSEEIYELVKIELEKLANKPEDALLKALNIDE